MCSAHSTPVYSFLVQLLQKLGFDSATNSVWLLSKTAGHSQTFILTRGNGGIFPSVCENATKGDHAHVSDLQSFNCYISVRSFQANVCPNTGRHPKRDCQCRNNESQYLNTIISYILITLLCCHDWKQQISRKGNG